MAELEDQFAEKVENIESTDKYLNSCHNEVHWLAVYDEERMENAAFSDNRTG